VKLSTLCIFLFGGISWEGLWYPVSNLEIRELELKITAICFSLLAPTRTLPLSFDFSCWVSTLCWVLCEVLYIYTVFLHSSTRLCAIGMVIFIFLKGKVRLREMTSLAPGHIPPERWSLVWLRIVVLPVSGLASFLPVCFLWPFLTQCYFSLPHSFGEFVSWDWPQSDAAWWAALGRESSSLSGRAETHARLWHGGWGQRRGQCFISKSSFQ